MKVREIISERNEKLDEFLGFGALGGIIWKLFLYYQLTQPITKAWTNMQDIYSKYKSGEPGYTKEKVDQMTGHELAQCSVELTALLLGNKIIGGLLGKIATSRFGGPVVKFFTDMVAVLGKTKFMEWVNSEQVVGVISNWLLGHIFTEKFPIIGQSGPLYDKYVGEGLLHALQELKPQVDKLKQKVFDIEPEQDPSQTPAAKADIDATSTSPSAITAPQQQRPAYDYGTKLRITPGGVYGAPDRPNVSLK